MNFAIKNVRIIDANTDCIGDVFVNDGIITKENVIGATVIDGSGLVLMPSFTDLHAHFRDPGFTHKEDIASGSRASVKGGYTTVVLMANTNPVCSTMDTVNYVRSRASEVGLVNAEPVVTITDGMKGESVAHLDLLDDSIRFISDDGKGVASDELTEQALEIAKRRNFVLISHAEDPAFSATDMREAENRMTARDIAACLKTGGHLHLAHVSTAEAVRMVDDAKRKGAKLTCETTPHHIFATEETVYRVNPPLRRQYDVEALVDGIKSGIIDTISTDHAPHTPEDKQNGAPGMSGIEISFQICLTKLVKEGHIDLKKLSEIISLNPSRIFGTTRKGLIKPGLEADLVLVDIDKRSRIDASKFLSKGKNTPFDGREVFGEVIMTFKKGKKVFG